MKTFDVIVLGVGGVGSAAALELSRRGRSVLGIERFGPAHARGSSHGETRIIRQAYFEHPSYVPLAKAAYGWWSNLQNCGSQRANDALYVRTGLLQVGPAGGHVLRGVRQSAELHDLTIENLTPAEVRNRWPNCYAVPDDMEGVFEQESGYLRVEACVQAQITEAERLGAQFRFDEPAINWRPTSDGIEVLTPSGKYGASQLVIAAGAWAKDVLGQPDQDSDGGHSTLRLPLGVRRKPQYWFAAKDDRYLAGRGAPGVLFELPHGVFYSFPQIGDSIKVAEHSGGASVDDPTNLDCEIDDAELQRVRDFFTRHLPGISGKMHRQAACMYTMSPDEHFIVDRHPGLENVVFAAGLSGHGFKFVGILAQALVDLLQDGKTELPIGFLSCSRAELDSAGK